MEDRSRGDVAKKKDVHEHMCKSGNETNKARYKNISNRAKKVVAKPMKEAAEWELRELSEHPNNVFKLVKSMEKDGGKMLREEEV